MVPDLSTVVRTPLHAGTAFSRAAALVGPSTMRGGVVSGTCGELHSMRQRHRPPATHQQLIIGGCS